MKREPDIEYVLSLSYGKDSLACLGAIELMNYPLDRIVHFEVWATDDIPADLPEMVEFKKKADEIIKKRFGIKVEHFVALDKKGNKLTYEKIFYRKKKQNGAIYGFPIVRGSWCNSKLKLAAEKEVQKVVKGKSITYLGIACDEPKRIERHIKRENIILPLINIGWDESTCRKWCENNDLLSPIYKTSSRGGCWFCHFQSVEQLRLLRKNYPHLWDLLLKWDKDSPITFKPNNISVHDFEKRFDLEDKGYHEKDVTFSKMNHPQTNIFQFMKEQNNENI